MALLACQKREGKANRITHSRSRLRLSTSEAERHRLVNDNNLAEHLSLEA
jgi:hypothetical protein